MTNDPTRYYLAAPFAQREEAKGVRKLINKTLGWECEATWIDKHLTNDAATPAQLAAEADEDLGDIVASDVFVLLNSGMSEGKAVETGYALAEGIPIVVIGPITPTRNVFLYLPGVSRFDTVEEFVQAEKGKG